MAIAPPLSEREFARQVVDLATVLGWHTASFRPAQTMKGWRTPVSGSLGAGWPDLTLVRARDQRVIFAELKAEKGRLSADQEFVHGVLRASGQAVYVWRPSDFDALALALR